MTSRKNINIFDFNRVNVAKHWHVAGEVFAISDCLVQDVLRPCVNITYDQTLSISLRVCGPFAEYKCNQRALKDRLLVPIL